MAQIDFTSAVTLPIDNILGPIVYLDPTSEVTQARLTATKLDYLESEHPKLLILGDDGAGGIDIEYYQVLHATADALYTDADTAVVQPAINTAYVDLLTFPLSDTITFNVIETESTDVYDNTITEYYLRGETVTYPDGWEVAGYVRSAITLRQYDTTDVYNFQEWISVVVEDLYNYRFTLVDLDTLVYDAVQGSLVVTEYYWDGVAWTAVTTGAAGNTLLSNAGYDPTGSTYDTYHNTIADIIANVRTIPLRKFAISMFASTSTAKLNAVTIDYREAPNVPNRVYLYGYLVDYSGNPVEGVTGYILPSHIQNSEAQNSAIYQIGNQTIRFVTDENGYFEIPLLPYTNGLVTIPALDFQITFALQADSVNIREFIDATSYNYALFRPT